MCSTTGYPTFALQKSEVVAAAVSEEQRQHGHAKNILPDFEAQNPMENLRRGSERAQHSNIVLAG